MLPVEILTTTLDMGSRPLAPYRSSARYRLQLRRGTGPNFEY